jgi:hypothetical protein
MEAQIYLMLDAISISLTRSKILINVIFIMTVALGSATAQQSSNGDCSPNVYGVGGNVNITCNPSQKSKLLSEQENLRIRQNTEQQKIDYIRRNGGCDLNTHPVYHPQFGARTCELNE